MLDPENIKKDLLVRSGRGRIFKILNRGRYGFNCSVSMISYTNLEPTDDAPAGTVWFLEEDFFIKKFTEV